MAFSSDLRYALRMLRSNPAFSVPAVALIALGIGANTAVFSVVEGVLLRPLPYHDPSRLCMIWKSVPAKSLDWDWTGYPAIRDWRSQSHVFEDIAAVARPEASVMTLTGGAEPRRIQAAEVEGNFFRVLGSAPRLGRTFSPGESRRGEPVAILSYAFWRQHFGGSRSALGSALTLNHRSWTIAGVMPPEFQFPDRKTQIWLLLSADPRWEKFQQYRFADAFTAIGRLKRGVSLAKSKAEMNTIAKRLAVEYPATDAGLGIRVVPLAEWMAGAQVRRSLWVLLGAVFCVLLVTCTNIANLMLARGVARSREFALRAALGAGRGRLVRQLLTESVLISCAGGLLGILLAAAGLKALLTLAPANLPRLDEVHVDPVVLGFATLLSIFTGLLFGLLPARSASRRDPQEVLRGGGRTGSARSSAGLPLIAGQCSIALVLLTGAGLLARSFLELQNVKPGFEPRHLLTFTLDLPGGMAEQKAQGIVEQTVAAIDRLPGVQSAAVGGIFQDHIPNGVITVEGQLPEEGQPFVGWGVSPGYFQTMRMPLLRGRVFEKKERSGTVVSESFARHFWPGQDPLGKRFKISLPGLDEGNWSTVIGVVGDRSSYGPGSAMLPAIYGLASAGPSVTMVVRTAGDPTAMAAVMRQTVRAIEPAIPHFEITTAERQMLDLEAPRRFETTLLAIFSALSLLLAAAGIYSFLHYAVAQRSREIGIRLALGAQNSDVVILVLGQVLRSVAAGALIGLLASLAATRVLASVLYGVTATDPATFAGAVIFLFLVAAAAGSFPAYRAGRVDPAAALRQE